MNPILKADGYKHSHFNMFPPDTEFVYSNWTPRSSRVPGQNTVVHFGIQRFVKKVLIGEYGNEFFAESKACVVKDYRRFMNSYVGISNPDTRHIEFLHEIGYVPMSIYSLPEGSSVPLNVPAMVFVNTLKEARWLPNFTETAMSLDMWKPSTTATTAQRLRRLCVKWAIEAGETDRSYIDYQFHDFSMRGMSGIEDVVLSGMGHLLSFSGTDSVPSIFEAMKYYNADIGIGKSVPACYDDQTEIMTNNGFKLFKDISKLDLVAQYHMDGTIDFTTPSAYYCADYSGEMITFTKPELNYVDICVTPNHRMVKRRQLDNSIEFFEAGAETNTSRGNSYICGNYSHRSRIIIAGSGVGGINKLTAVDKLRIAFQADGSFASRKEKYTGEKTGTLPIRFSLKKDRKAIRLKSILKETGYEFTDEKYGSGYYSFWIKTPDTESFTKDLSWVDITAVSAEWARSFVDEVQYWDGCHTSKDTITYSTSVKSCAEVAQMLGALAGYKTQWGEYEDPRGDRQVSYTVRFTLSKSELTGAGVVKDRIQYKGKVYCVTVPTGMLVVRRNHVVVICGNSEHSITCCGGQETEYETFRWLLEEIYATGVLSLVSDTWDIWRVLTEYVPKLREMILARDGVFVCRPDSGDPVKILLGDPAFAWIAHSYPGTVARDQPDAGLHPAAKGVIRLLGEVMGVDKNRAGLPLINKAAAIYGDSINEERADQILCGIVRDQKLSPRNVLFGVGSYSYELVTRDNYGFAMKATAVVRSGKLIPIFKDPVTDDGGKRSHKGIPAVYKTADSTDLNPIYYVKQGAQPEDLDNCAFRKVFENGKLLIDENFDTIRQRVRSWQNQ